MHVVYINALYGKYIIFKYFWDFPLKRFSYLAVDGLTYRHAVREATHIVFSEMARFLNDI